MHAPCWAMSFGGSVRSKRKEHGLTLEQLSERAGITPNYLGRIENGKADPSLSVVRAIARGLRTRVGDLVDEDDTTERSDKHRTRRYEDAFEIAKALQGLPLDVRETLLPALQTVADRIGPRPLRRTRQARRRSTRS